MNIDTFREKILEISREKRAKNVIFRYAHINRLERLQRKET